MRNEAKEAVRGALRTVAIGRRCCVLFDGDDQNEVDEFIRQEGELQIEEIDKMDKEELMMLMINEVIGAVAGGRNGKMR